MTMRVYANESGDWMVVKDITNGEVLFEGHSMTAWDVACLLDQITIEGCELKRISNEDMEEGNYQ